MRKQDKAFALYLHNEITCDFTCSTTGACGDDSPTYSFCFHHSRQRKSTLKLSNMIRITQYDTIRSKRQGEIKCDSLNSIPPCRIPATLASHEPLVALTHLCPVFNLASPTPFFSLPFLSRRHVTFHLAVRRLVNWSVRRSHS